MGASPAATRASANLFYDDDRRAVSKSKFKERQLAFRCTVAMFDNKPSFSSFAMDRQGSLVAVSSGVVSPHCGTERYPAPIVTHVQCRWLRARLFFQFQGVGPPFFSLRGTLIHSRSHHVVNYRSGFTGRQRLGGHFLFRLGHI
ncbi:hypothetical protein PAXRUDRAFT_831749, partial [Paxillus rubicundulus Ve08.2h10]